MPDVIDSLSKLNHEAIQRKKQKRINIHELQSICIAYEQGRNYRKHGGVSMANNPYLIDTNDFRAWLFGYSIGEQL